MNHRLNLSNMRFDTTGRRVTVHFNPPNELVKTFLATDLGADSCMEGLTAEPRSESEVR